MSTLVHAGPLTAVFDRASLRWISYGHIEILRGIYGAVRDVDWRTVPPIVRVLALDQQPDSFHIAFEARHTDGALDFLWNGHIDGMADGSLTFTFDGEARSSFVRNRIGLCVLHPLPGQTPRGAVAGLVGGGSREFSFPTAVSPHQVAMHHCGMHQVVRPGVLAEIELSGETFETEDQRNWSDVSFKTYGTPVDLPAPVQLEAGHRVKQAVSLRFRHESTPTLPAADMKAAAARRIWLLPGSHAAGGRALEVLGAPVQLELTVETRPLPRVGVALAAGADVLTPGERGRLALLNLSHVHAQLDLAAPDWGAAFERAAGESRALGLPLELAVVVREEDAGDRLEALGRAAFRANAPIARWSIFDAATATTPAQLALAARRHLRPLAPHVPIGGGSAAHFAQLNRHRPPADTVDYLVYGVTPQAHDYDEATMMENTGSVGDVHRSIRAFAPGRAIVVSPVTLQARPVRPDARHRSPFAAAWTTAHLAQLVEHGTEAVTYFETVGHAGVLDAAPHVERPVARLLAAVGEYRGASARLVRSSQPDAVAALALTDGRRATVLVANLRAVETGVLLPGEKVAIQLEPHGVFQRELGRSLAAR